MKAIILLGAPGAGKGTAAERIKESTPYIHVSTGDMLRQAVKEQTDIGRGAEGYMERGPLMMRVVNARLDAGDQEGAYLFDGFPRTVRQAEILEDALAKRHGELKKVFYLNSPRQVLIQRLTGRRICRQCGSNYHVLNMPPAKDGVCDSCGGELYQRPDDEEATIVNRLNVFTRQTGDLIQHYRDLGLLVELDSSVPADEFAVMMLGLLKDI